jgi:hypothetical protein
VSGRRTLSEQQGHRQSLSQPLAASLVGPIGGIMGHANPPSENHLRRNGRHGRAWADDLLRRLPECSHWASGGHCTRPHADTSRFMQNVSITEGSGGMTSAIQCSQSSSDAKVGLFRIGWHWSAPAPTTMHTATKKIGAVIGHPSLLQVMGRRSNLTLSPELLVTSRPYGLVLRG